ncbi:MAG: preprotein translocase subunit SecE [Planctomycetota bacterium]|jgi:preprotein translocase subunit SecE
MSWKVYRPGEGRWARLIALVAFLGLAGFSAYRWHLWASAWDARAAVWILPRIGVHQLTWAEIGAGVLLAGFALLGYRTCFARPRTSDFLIETEIELRKVTWPAWKPLFRWNTELWGNTYVVIVVIVALALFLFAVDMALQTASGAIFFRVR